MESVRTFGRTIAKLLAFVLLLGVVGGLAWFVWQAKHNTDKSLNNTSQNQGTVTKPITNTEKPAPKAESTDLTADWTPVSSAKGKFSFRYPKTWVQPTNRDLCSPELFDRAVYLGPDTDSVLKCASEYFGQISVNSVDGDKRSESALSKGYKDITDKEVAVNGLVGHRIAGVAVVAPPEMGFAPVEGTIEVHYVFYSPSGVTYVARYTQAPKGHAPSMNVLNDFDLLVTKTLKFSS